jgi:hypothetical protein
MWILAQAHGADRSWENRRSTRALRSRMQKLPRAGDAIFAPRARRELAAPPAGLGAFRQKPLRSAATLRGIAPSGDESGTPFQIIDRHTNLG